MKSSNTLSISLSKKKNYFYWKYIYGDLVISKMINYLTKQGKKNRAIKFFLKALFNIKTKFGLNPILLVKYVLLKRNNLTRITTKKVGVKDHYYVRVLTPEKQMSQTIRALMSSVLLLNKRKKLKLWQALMVVIFNFAMKKKKKKYNNNKFFIKMYNNFFFHKQSSIILYFSLLKKSYILFFSILKKIIYSLKYIYSKIFFLYSVINNLKKSITFFFLNKKLNSSSFFCFFYFLKKFRKFIFRLNFFFEQFIFLFFNSSFLFELKNKLIVFFNVLLYNRKKQLNLFLSIYKNKLRKKRYIFNKRFKKWRNTPLMKKFFYKDLRAFYAATKYKNSIVNFKHVYKKKNDLKLSVRLHKRYDEKLTKRRIFFRTTKHGRSINK